MPPVPVFPTNQPLSSAELNTVWDAVTDDLRSALGEATFDLWFGRCRLLQVVGHRAVISAPGSMYAIWIEENFREVLKFSLDQYLEDLKGFSFEFEQEAESAGASVSPFAESVSGSLSGLSGDGEQRGEARRADAPGAAGRRRSKKKNKTPLSPEEILEKGRDGGLTEVHSFDNFVVGENSEMAVAAGRAVVEKPGSTYQPLFLHSSSGMGKTHLLHAIGWAFLEKRPHARVLYVGAEKFANEFIDAIRGSSESAFRKKYREADLLLIDDVQFLGGKAGLQREFFHTFNTLVNARNQIVIASDCPASEISQLEERLVSRLQWGLTVEIESPGEEVGEAILRRKRDDWQLSVSDGIIARIVQCVSNNVRQLEGALIRTAMVTSMGRGALDEDRIDDLLSDLVDLEKPKSPALEDIKGTVADFFNCETKDLEGKRRTAEITKARQVAMYLCRDLTDHSLKEIAACFAKDHASVVYAAKAVKTKCSRSESLKNSVEMLRRKLTRGGAVRESVRARRSSSSSEVEEVSREVSREGLRDQGLEVEILDKRGESFLG